MAIPTITSIAPDTGPSGGYALVFVTGTNFNLGDPVEDSGPTTVKQDSVSVTINGEPALRVQVVSSTEVWALTPPFHGVTSDDPIPAVAIVITNLDSSGDPVVGEVATLTDAYTYRRPVIHSTAGKPVERPHPIALVSAGLILALRRQVFLNVVQTTHVDYAEPGLLTLNLAKIPSIVVQGPNITKDFDYTHNEVDYVSLSDTVIAMRQPPDVLRFSYSFLCVTDNEQESLNIMGSMQLFFMKNKYLSVQIDPLDPDQGRADLVLQITQQPQATSTPSDNNLRVWVAAAEVRGVEIHLDENADQFYAVTEIHNQVQQLTGTTLEDIQF